MSSELDNDEPLTPSHFMVDELPTYLTHFATMIPVMTPSNPEAASHTEHQAKRKDKLLQHFWNRWRQEYCTSLREFHKVSGQNEVELKVGDIVQVHSDTKHVNWRLAVVERLIEGKDGLVRAAEIKTSTGFTSRPITKLYPLKVISATHTATKPPKILTPTTPTESTRTPRKAARIAREKIKTWASDSFMALRGMSRIDSNNGLNINRLQN